MLKVELNPAELSELNKRFDAAHPTEIVQWATERFADELIMTSSFGAESMCLVHMVNSAKPGIRIVVVNTGYLFPETLTFMEQMRTRFNLNILQYHTKNDPVTWLTVNGEPDPRQRKNVDACCAANKNEVFDRAMREQTPAAWLRGVRADQSADRAKMAIVQWSKRNNCWAISPLLHWNNRQIFQYMKQHDLPYHPLREKGYFSIGCSPETCTRALSPENDAANQRGGRWAGMDKKECGINLEDN